MHLRDTFDRVWAAYETDKTGSKAAAMVVARDVPRGFPVRQLQVRSPVRVLAAATAERGEVSGLPAEGEVNRRGLGMSDRSDRSDKSDASDTHSLAYFLAS
jgi:hypothetical protein